MATVKNKSIHKKRRGRPKRPGGPDPVVPVRLPKSLKADVDRWAKAQGIKKRSVAMVQLVEIGLAGGGKIPVYRASGDDAEE
jgi:hypothetical protein